jgi:hypothetical protein
MKDKILLKCDEELERIIKEVQEEHKLTWDEASEMVDECILRIIRPEEFVKKDNLIK